MSRVQQALALQTSFNDQRLGDASYSAGARRLTCCQFFCWLSCFLGFLFVLITPLQSRAQSTIEFNELAKIKYKAVSPSRRHVDTDELERMAGTLKKLGFVDQTLVYKASASKLNIQQIFSTNDLSRSVIIRYNSEPVEKRLMGSRIEVTGEGHLVHSATKQKTAFVAFFVSFKKIEINQLMLAMTGDLSRPTPEVVRKRSFGLSPFVPLLLASANANQTCPTTLQVGSRALLQAGAATLSFFADCGKQIWGGFQSTIIGDFKDLADGTTIGYMVKLVKLAQGQWNSFSEVVANLYPGLENHPRELAMIFCNWLGGLLGGVALTAETAGLGIIADATEKFAKIAEFIDAAIEHTDFVRDRSNIVGTTSGETQILKKLHCSGPSSWSPAFATHYGSPNYVPSKSIR